MENVKLIDFLLKYNFRKPNETGNGFYTKIVRIYLSEVNLDDWIEYGLYDFGGEDSKKNRIIYSLNKNLAERKVSYYCYDELEEVFSIFLEEEVKR